jgi:hypothetical protein
VPRHRLARTRRAAVESLVEHARHEARVVKLLDVAGEQRSHELALAEQPREPSYL